MNGVKKCLFGLRRLCEYPYLDFKMKAISPSCRSKPVELTSVEQITIFSYLMKAILDPIDFHCMDKKEKKNWYIFHHEESQLFSEKKVYYWGSTFSKGTKLHHSGTKVYHLGIKCSI